MQDNSLRPRRASPAGRFARSPHELWASVTWLALFLGSSRLPACNGPLRINARAHNVARSSEPTLDIYELESAPPPTPRSRPRGTVLYVPGSTNTSVTGSIGAFPGFVMMDMRVVMLERRGVHGAEVDPGAPAFSTKPHRVADVRAGLEATLANAEPQAPVFLVGASEGGDVAAAVAADDPRVTHLILLGTGGGMSQAEELELEIPDMEHHLRGHDGVPMLPLIEVHVVRWLVDTGVLANAEALAFDRRVRKNHPEWFAR